MSANANVLSLEKEPLQRVLQKFNESLGEYINDDQRNRLGIVLTVVDAAIADPTQRKAIKDLIQNQWWGGGGIRETRADGMYNPHTDLRAICQLFGFELYDPKANALPMGGSERDTQQEWAVKRYSKVANE